jgi:hypothetical protein
VADSETIRPGLALIVTGPGDAASVTGNDAAALLLAEVPAAEVPAAEVLPAEVLAAELQPASSAVAATAASIQRVLFMVCHFLPDRDGRRDRRPPARALASRDNHPSHEGRYRRNAAVGGLAWVRGTDRHSCGTAPE